MDSKNESNLIEKPVEVSRRRVTKASIVVCSLPVLLPEVWTKPILNSIVLPAHAQTSQGADVSIDSVQPEVTNFAVREQDTFGEILLTIANRGFSLDGSTFARFSLLQNLGEELFVELTTQAFSEDCEVALNDADRGVCSERFELRISTDGADLFQLGFRPGSASLVVTVLLETPAGQLTALDQTDFDVQIAEAST